MNIFRKILAGAFVAAISAAAICAQQQPARPTVTPASTGSATVPESRIALINSEALDDEKTGILKLAAAIKRVAAMAAIALVLSTAHSETPRNADLARIRGEISRLRQRLEVVRSQQRSAQA